MRMVKDVSPTSVIGQNLKILTLALNDATRKSNLRGAERTHFQFQLQSTFQRGVKGLRNDPLLSCYV